MKTNVALIGFMGTGKTAVGKALAARLGKAFVETDALIERMAGKSIPEIFRQDGEIAFREMEIAVIKEAAAGENAVIACGGGAVLNKINTDRLKQRAVMVYLTASPAIILRRTADDKDGRPLLPAEGRAAQVKELLRFRRPFYEGAADMKIDTSGLTVAAVAENIVNRLNEDADYRK